MTRSATGVRGFLLQAAVCLPLAAAEPAERVTLTPDLLAWGLPPRSQGDRGTCSVFTIVGAMEYALARGPRKGTRLSVEFLNWASNETIGRRADGGFFADLWQGYLAHGICPESALPYRPRFEADLRPTPAALQQADALRRAGLRLHWIKRWDIDTGLTDDQFARIKQTLADRWPVCGGLRWPKREKWHDGVLAMCPPEEVFDGHSVLLTGFRDDPLQPGGGVFLVRDSRRRADGTALPYRYARDYMNDAAWVAPPADAARR